ncbi:MAG TPA: adenosylcobinamide-GDP ribazoletransferase, partial [Streptosporangiaceae bacterium]|nr:adenosylcobinamide-GDP ribazoletransferase [Streptosporangiaceae bacterium]
MNVRIWTKDSPHRHIHASRDQPGDDQPGQGRRVSLAALRDALGMFTVVPLGARAVVTREEAARAVLWLPVAGVLLTVPAVGVLVLVEAGGHSGARTLLAATLAVAVLGAGTGGLHLDGLADTADGLGSRRPRDQALAIMRRPDAGPLGVVTLVVVVLVQISALASLGAGWQAAAALTIAVLTARVAVVLATGPGSPPARPEGFGALVAGATSTRAMAAAVTALVAGVAVAATVMGGPVLLARALAAV